MKHTNQWYLSFLWKKKKKHKGVSSLGKLLLFFLNSIWTVAQDNIPSNIGVKFLFFLLSFGIYRPSKLCHSPGAKPVWEGPNGSIQVKGPDQTWPTSCVVKATLFHFSVARDWYFRILSSESSVMTLRLVIMNHHPQ